MYEIIHVNDPHTVDRYNAHVHNKPVMVLFYMDGCGHCEMMKPEWKAFEDEYRHKPHHNGHIIIAKVNQNYINMVEGHSSVSGFPTIYHLHNGKKVSEFNKERNLENFKQYIDTIERHDKKHKMEKRVKGGSRVNRKKSVSKTHKTQRHNTRKHKSKRNKKTHKRKTKHRRVRK